MCTRELLLFGIQASKELCRGSGCREDFKFVLSEKVQVCQVRTKQQALLTTRDTQTTQAVLPEVAAPLNVTKTHWVYVALEACCETQVSQEGQVRLHGERHLRPKELPHKVRRHTGKQGASSPLGWRSQQEAPNNFTQQVGTRKIGLCTEKREEKE